MKLKEATCAEVAVELDEDLIGGGGHAFLHGGATELTDLRRRLVRSIPGTETRGCAEREEGVVRGKGERRRQMIYE